MLIIYADGKSLMNILEDTVKYPKRLEQLSRFYQNEIEIKTPSDYVFKKQYKICISMANSYSCLAETNKIL